MSVYGIHSVEPEFSSENCGVLRCRIMYYYCRIRKLILLCCFSSLKKAH